LGGIEASIRQFDELHGGERHRFSYSPTITAVLPKRLVVGFSLSEGFGLAGSLLVSAGAFPSAFWWRSSAGPPSLLVLEEFTLDLGIGMNFWDNFLVRFGGGAIVSGGRAQGQSANTSQSQGAIGSVPRRREVNFATSFNHLCIAKAPYAAQRPTRATFFNYENPELFGISSYMPGFPVSSICGTQNCFEDVPTLECLAVQRTPL
jgi:hypothetical protein